jgi:hypothetical protein
LTWARHTEKKRRGSSRREGGRGLARAPTQAHRTRVVHHAGIGEGKGTNRWAGATVPWFESIQTGQVIPTMFEFKF